jgi:hypothetical protein
MTEEQNRHPSPAAIAGFAVVLAVAATIGYEVLQPAPAAPAVLPPPAVAEVESAPPAMAPVLEPPSVRVRNPFDKSEVFEFPAGTTPEAAHEAVAETLLARARERQAEHDARHHNHRRPPRPG